ncbi:hypothetical protein ACQP2P_15780 [Dactylosporangium sp. CA-139114]|uniref:hypothetical protein n=1 Tax=Dactylosporangium sp. CA-139114 TaxID=3239931 RepID=UPI003D99932D
MTTPSTNPGNPGQPQPNERVTPDPMDNALETVALLTGGLAELHDTVAALAEDHFKLREEIRAAAGPTIRSGAPADLRWQLLDRPTAANVWVWLIDWVAWISDRYQLTEELPACWHRHPALVDELTALAASWHVAYDPRATGDAPLRWLEAFARARARIRDWDEPTRCRNGEHTDRRVDLHWPPGWRDTALDTAEADGRERPLPPGPANAVRAAAGGEVDPDPPETAARAGGDQR